MLGFYGTQQYLLTPIMCSTNAMYTLKANVKKNFRNQSTHFQEGYFSKEIQQNSPQPLKQKTQKNKNKKK